jgi:hypothetical protein
LRQDFGRLKALLIRSARVILGKSSKLSRQGSVAISLAPNNFKVQNGLLATAEGAAIRKTVARNHGAHIIGRLVITFRVREEGARFHRWRQGVC